MTPRNLRRAKVWLAEQRRRELAKGRDHMAPVIEAALQAVQACILAHEDMARTKDAQRAYPDTQPSGDPGVAPTQWHGGYLPTQIAP